MVAIDKRHEPGKVLPIPEVMILCLLQTLPVGWAPSAKVLCVLATLRIHFFDRKDFVKWQQEYAFFLFSVRDSSPVAATPPLFFFLLKTEPGLVQEREFSFLRSLVILPEINKEGVSEQKRQGSRLSAALSARILLPGKIASGVTLSCL